MSWPKFELELGVRRHCAGWVVASAFEPIDLAIDGCPTQRATLQIQAHCEPCSIASNTICLQLPQALNSDAESDDVDFETFDF